MSNKMNETKTSLPKLRFPEFHGDWEYQKLTDIASVINEKAGNGKYTLMSITSGVGLVSQIEKFGREIAGQAYKNYIVIRENDFAYNKSSTKDAPEGFIAMYSGKEAGAVPNSIFTCFRTQRDRVIPKYLSYLFLGNLHGKWLRNFITVGARAHGSLNVDNEDLMSLPVPLPKKETLAEQQKIADCLTSLDDLIAAQSQKVEALQAYKKGLMQNLFPAEGESVPRLRFPEFQSAGEWEEIKLGELGTPILGLTYSPSDIRDEGLLVLRSPNIKDGVIVLDDCVYVTPDIKRANLSKPNDILICVRNGSTSLIGKNAIIPDGMPLCTHGAFMTVFRAKTPKFVYQLLQTKTYQIQVAAGLGARINSINNSQLVNYKFFVPTLLEEQQRIAELLSALDEQISVQGEALAALKVHKKGLMQGLFPSGAGRGRTAGG